MFTGYIIKNDVLYLEININYEFGNFRNEHKSIIEEINDYINKMKIKLKKGKIILTCSGVVIGSIFLTNINKPISNDNIKYVPSFKNDITYLLKDQSTQATENEIQENTEINQSVTTVKTEQKASNTNNKVENNSTNVSVTNSPSPNEEINNSATNPSGPTVTVYRSNGSVITIGLEEYVIGVVAAEMPASFNIEALKAQSVLARTYALKSQSTGKTLTDTVSTQAYIDIDHMRSNWGSGFDKYYNKIKNAVESTNGTYLSYNGTYIEALYHSTNNGKTESSLDVFGNYYPYLVSVTSEYDKVASSYLRTITMDLNTMSSKLGIDLTTDSLIEIMSYTDGNNIKEINIAGSTFTGKQVREALGLRSADFDISINGDSVNITTRGYGHGVGMSQYGANGMANAGYDYQSILSHYYPGTILKK